MFKLFVYTSAVIIVMSGFYACTGKNETGHDTHEHPIAVRLSTASTGRAPAIFASGVVEARLTANISTRLMGRITHILVNTGDRVKKGQLLATVWDEDLVAKRAQADAMIAETEGAFRIAQKDYDRFKNLYSQQSATAKELDNASLQYSSATAKVASAKQQRNEINATLSYSRLTAPFAGIVTQKLAEAGNIANPGMPVLTIEQNEILRISASVAESDISQIHLGDAATIQIKSTGRRFEGTIVQINPSSQFTGGQYMVKINIPENAKKDLYAGMFASVNIPVRDTAQINNGSVLVPLSALVYRDELTGIYTVSAAHTALLRWVRIGKIYGDNAEVITGISAKEEFILSAESKLFNGAPVQVKATAASPVVAAKRY
jgi:RND family efflux transporter MFP subunit